ncbi:MAG: hypothetical protein IKV26_03210 [Paludibacteraceae bacterium]|nr:hypothetical protein [Paludibacteraceae bacterium]
MKAIITYNEILDFVENKFRVRPTLSRIDLRNLEVSYRPMALMPAITIRLCVESVSQDEVVLSYMCNPAVEMMVGGVVTYFKQMIPDGVDVNTTTRKVNIYPQRIEQLNKALNYVVLSDIVFEEDSVNVVVLINV